jgi:hypothetical protein
LGTSSDHPDTTPKRGWAWIASFYQHAKTKLTTYLALGIAALAQLAQHADEAYTQWPTLMTFLPQSHVIVTACHYIATGLGLLVVYARVRRLIGSK